MAPMDRTHTKIVIVGAGFGGLGMGVTLKKAGEKDFVILEKSSNVGGVWRDNSYPGCTCDVPSHLYSFSFAPYRRRDKRYPPQQEILEYLEQVTEDHGLREHLHLNKEISKAQFREDENRWDILTTSEQNYSAEIVIFAVGQLHQPRYPDIPGMRSFEGPAFHSARWNHHVKFQGKRVGIIGTGSSAAQMLPILADIASSVTLYQRTPHWVLPKPSAKFSRASRMILRVPGFHRLYRKALSDGADILLSPITRSKTWRQTVEWYAVAALRRQVADRELVDKLMPAYPLGSKRIILDNDFYPNLTRENVHLVTEPIDSVSYTEIRTKDGASRSTDIIVCATGFRASDFLVPISVSGRGGHNLNDEWSSGAEAFMGLAVHGYPNLFVIAGPNTFNPAGSNPEMKELQIEYIMACLRWKQDTGAEAIEVDCQVAVRYEKWLRTKLEQTVWPESVDSWYRHETGKVTSPWPMSRRAFARLLRDHQPQRSFVAWNGALGPV
ncbi:hypothetical protein ACN47E_000337 [Coniothyrium glycines]